MVIEKTTLSTISSLATGNKIIGYIHNDQSEYYKEKSKFWKNNAGANLSTDK